MPKINIWDILILKESYWPLDWALFKLNAISEEENTITILNRYVDESEIDLDKSKIKGILQDIYKLAREVAE